MAGREIEQKIAGLSEAKRRLLEHRLREAGIVLEPAAIPGRRPDETEWPLSFGQQRFWFLEQLDPGSALNNIPVAVRMKGDLRLPVLEKCLADIVTRHEVLRTSFVKHQGQPLQVIVPTLDLPLRVVDLTTVPAPRREQDAREIVAAESQRPFDLSRAPLFRITLIRLGEDEHLLIAVMHHIISDGWSMGVFIQELATLYREYVAGRPSPLPPLAIQYADFARWQRQRLQGDLLDRELAYWREKLGDGGEPLELPTDRPRPAMQTNRGASMAFTLDRDLTENLKHLGLREDATLFMTLLAGFQTLLHRYTGQEQISVGTPIANRQHKEIEPLIGFFVNTLVMLTDLSGEPTFREAIGRVKEVALGAYAHQDVPFEKLVESLGVERDLSRTPLFQVMFILQNAPSQELELPGLRLQPEDTDTGQSTFDLTLSLAEREGVLSGAIEYNADLFDRETIEDLIAHYRILLNGAVETPDVAIGRLPLLAEAERRQVLTEWNRTDFAAPLDRCIHHLFEEQAAKNPEAVAVTDGSRFLRYGELEERANRLAHYLQRLGVGPERLVGICLERSPEMLIAILGIWKAGGAYVPMDPLYPRERIQLMLDDAEAVALIAGESLLAHLGDLSTPVVCLDGDWEKIGRESPERPVIAVGPDNLVYVLYTSGSTGKPKGVMVRHRGLVNAFHGWREAYDLAPLRSYLGIANITFDVFLGDIVRPLGSGGKLVLCPREFLFAPEKLYDLMIQEEVEYLEIVPAVLRPLLTYLEESGRRLDFLRVIVCGADSWTVGEFRQLKELSGIQTRVFNSYGVTEATVDNTYFEGPLDGYADDQILPLGIAYANQRLYVFDAHLQPQPIGVPGELYIGGEGVARGYLNNHSLTAEKFIEWPGIDGNAPAQRLYKTGDRARWRRDGSVQFFGRADFQVKIRGFRIEPGEVEAVLQQHPAVRQAAVIAHRDPDGDTQLVAYFTHREEVEPTTISGLREFLKGKLPEYMVPGFFIPLEVMPLTSSGKIARKALPAPDRSQVVKEERFVAPRTELEEQLTMIWAEVLKLDRIGITANFFEIGGHSLLATQLISRVRDGLGVELPLRSLFEAPTVSRFAPLVEEAIARGGHRQAPPILPVSRDRELPLSFGQQRLWFFDQYEPGSGVYNIPAIVRLEGDLDLDALSRSLNEVIRRHEVLRTTFASENGRPKLVIAAESRLTISVEDLRDVPEEEREAKVRALAFREAFRPFDLSGGPLLRVRLWKMAEREHVAALTMHHIVSDGWSSGVLIREMAELYQASRTGRPSPLPELTIQYADYAAWQRGWLQGEVLERELDYWRGQLEDGGEPLDLPTDRPRPAAQTNRGAAETFALPASLTARLKQIGQVEGATLFMTLLAGFQALLHRYSGQERISVGTPIANRHYSEIEPLIGFFVNTLVMRTDLGGEPSFRQLLQRVREVALGAYAHQEMPFDKLVDALGVERHLNHSPLFQVMFILQNTPPQEIQVEGLKITEFETGTDVATFDLTLAMAEEGDRLTGAVEYNTDLFDRETIVRMMVHFNLLLESAVAAPDQPMTLLPLMPETERRQLLYDWNDTRADVELDRCIHHLFEDQAARNPEKVAIKYGDSRLTYGELDRKSNQVAHRLQKLGVGPETLVGLCLERSLELFVAIFGIWKAGGAYVPIDPLYPEERIDLLLSDAGARAVMTQESLLPKLSKQTIPLVCLDRDWAEISRESTGKPESAVGPENMVYVIYTSGSTGRPKGVMVKHKGLVNAYHGWNLAYDLTPLRSYFGIANVTFDVFLGDLVRPLCNGAKYVPCPREILFSPPEFYRLLKQEEVDYLEFVPAVMRPLTEYLEESGQRLDFIRVIVCGADSWNVGEFQRLKELCGPRTRLFNGYGVTEATIDNTFYEGDLEGYRPDQVLPLGIAYANQQLYVLDPRLQPQPIGVPGELCIGGEGVARGYLNNPELTAEKFVWWHRDGPEAPPVRIYRTGDLARWHRDGHVQFLGRNDFQVKIRGFRIETGEIESLLVQHAKIKQAVVIAREDEAGRKRLVAYLVSSDQAPLDTSELKSYLGEKLPDYMIPPAFVTLESIPVTSHGKIDRKKLPAPQFEAAEQQSAAAETSTEEKLIEIWKQVLGIKQVGATDNFFELGGDSILSIQVIARARQAGIQLTPKQLFENPTVRGQASVATMGKAIVAEQGVITGPLPLTPIQHWFIEQEFAEPWHWNQTVLLEVHREMSRDLLEAALTKLIEHHDALRLRFSHQDGEWRQENAAIPAEIPLAWHDLSVEDEVGAAAKIERLCAEHQTALSLDQGLLLKAAYFDLGKDRPGRLLLAIHHLAVDGVSWRILLEDLPRVYEDLKAGREPRLPAKTTSFKQWARRLAEYARSDDVRQELDYWLGLADGATVALPVDDPAGTATEAEMRTVAVSLDAAETEALLQHVPAAYGTEINDVLLTALAEALTAWTGSRAVLVMLEGHGREDILPDVDLSRTVGWFTTEFPVRLERPPAGGPGEALKRMKEQRQRLPKGGLGFGLLRYLSPDPEIRRHLKNVLHADIGFNYLGQFNRPDGGEDAFRPAREEVGPMRSPRARMSNLIEINGGIGDGQLRLEWSYSERLYRKTTIENVAGDFLSALRRLIAHCQAPDAGGYTPSDFNLAGLDRRQLDKVLGKLGRGKK